LGRAIEAAGREEQVGGEADTPGTASGGSAGSGPAAGRSCRAVPLIAASSLQPGSVTQVSLPSGHALAVYRLGEEYFVSDDVCTHGEASLAEGEIEDGTIVCPYHQGSFDIRTGEPVAYPCEIPLKVYPTRIESGSVCVLLEEGDGAAEP